MLNKFLNKSNLKLKKLTFFEMLIIACGLIIMVSVFFILFRTKKDITITIKVNEDNVQTQWEGKIIPHWNSTIWLSNIFYPGMKEKSSLGGSTAEVISIKKYDNRPESSTIYITIKLKTVYSPGTNVYTYKGKSVLVGSRIQLFLDSVFVDALIVNMDDKSEKYPLKKLRVSTRLINGLSDSSFNSQANKNPNYPVFTETTGVYQFIADNINEGAIVKDSRGQTVLRIIDKKVEEADQIVKTANGEVLLRKNPLLKDVTLSLEVMAYRIDNRYYFFDNIPILVNNTLPIHLNNISIFPVITKVETAE